MLASANPFSDPRARLLWAVRPLLPILRGDKKEFLRRAWIDCALELSSEVLSMRKAAFPQSARNAALQLHTACLDLAHSLGISNIDLVDHFNSHNEANPGAIPERADVTIPVALEKLDEMFALLIATAARKQESAIAGE